MIEGRDIVCFSFGAWDDMVETPQYLMTRLAKRNRVLYIDAPVSPLGALRGLQGPKGTWRAIRNWRRGYRQIAGNLWVAAPPPILPKRTNRFVNRINAAWLRRWLSAQARSLGFDRPIYWTFQPRFPSIGRALNPSVSLYYCVDDFAAAPYDWNNEAEVRALEEQTCRESDVVICTGRRLVENRRAFNPETHFIPEAADVGLFAQAMDKGLVAPAEIASLPGKVVGYTGLINWRIDVPLMLHLAQTHTEWSIALVGPVKDEEYLAPLLALPNVHCYGRKTIEELPAYLKAMDVCILPYVLNEYTHNVFPLKLFEYAAAGKAIISTDMYEMRAYEGRELAIGRTPEDFERHLVEALACDSPERRLARSDAAREHTWENRLAEVARLLAPHLSMSPAAAASPLAAEGTR
jgi:glycosyltransferase involved in cell wall biosynthesis